MRKVVRITGLIVALGLYGCDAPSDDAKPPVAEAQLPAKPFINVTLTPAGQAAVQAQNAFTVDLYAAVAAKDTGDLLLSPASIVGALNLASAGARGTTAAAFAKALHSPADAHPGWGELLRASQIAAKDRIVSINNAIWIDKKTQIVPSYAALVQKHYGAALKGADLSGNPDASAAEINRWVARQTRNRIPAIIAPDAINSQTRVVLVNAAYFKGVWQAEFEKDYTQTEDFIRADATRIKMPLMHQTAWFRFWRAPGRFRAIAMPYREGETEMVAFLPDAPSGLPALEQKMKAGGLSGWIAKLKASEEKEVILTLPKFKLERDYELNEPLAALGLGVAFALGADFSAMGADTDGNGLYINRTVHRSFIELDEKGTVAAAVTSAEAGAAAAEISEPPPEFRADHPFLFLIRDTRTGAILFIGRFVGDARA